MCNLDKIRFETINTEIYINAKDVFKVYADNKNSAKTLLILFCKTNNIILKFDDYMLVNELIKYFEKYTPKREKYKEKFIQILAYINNKLNDFVVKNFEKNK